LATLVAVSDLGAQGAVDPDHGVVAVGRLLRGLGSVKRVLIIGAHPDDEDTALLTWVERGMGGDAAYLSLNRGEGGQNLIGPELGVGLGLVRTGELLAARRLDGASQYFTRAYDFGYSKSAEETFTFYPRDQLLADVVAVVRRFRPQVIVAVFSGTRRDGHGQHQVAGILASEAFDAAGDPQRFPEQIAHGLQPWTPLKLYRSARFNRVAATLEVETGVFDPLYGRSYHQIAMASRSQHRSQDMGRIESLGPRQTAIRLDVSRVGTDSASDERSLFDGVDTTLTGTLGGIDDDEMRRGLEENLHQYQRQLDRAWSNLASGSRVASDLSAALSSLRRALRAVQDAGPGGTESAFVLRQQEKRLELALTEAAGVIVDAFTDDDLAVPGQTIEVEVLVWNGGGLTVEIEDLVLRAPTGWDVEAIADADRAVPPGALARRRFSVTIPPDAEPTRPYFLRLPRGPGVYNWPSDSPELGLPFGTPVLRTEVGLALAGVRVGREVEAVYRFADQAIGEVRRPFQVVPAVGVTLGPNTTVWPLVRRGAGTFSVALSGEAPAGVSGRVRLNVPTGWSVTPIETAFSLDGPGAVAAAEFNVEPPRVVEAGTYTLTAVAETPEGRSYDVGYSVVDYSHIRRSLLFEEATARIEAFDLVVDKDVRVAYVPGAGDAVAEAIEAMGLTVARLDERAVAAGDLSRYDVIILGIRAYETNSALVASNGRFLDWVKAGGTLVSQYQQYSYFRGDYAPYPLQARRPHDRVSDENAPVRVLLPAHALISEPNRIGPADFEGWVQERGLYFANEWDDRYVAPLATADPGEDPKRGGLLIAELGEGLYVYTGLSLFRQLPAGVPGAYRLLANLLSLGG
jgi:LmbE family N-acetylglucosaminyl deacetylase